MKSFPFKNIWKAVVVEGKVAGIRDWLLLGKIFMLLTLLPVALRLVRIEKLLRLLSSNSSGRKKEVDPEKVMHYTDAILNLNIKGLGRNCLRRSLTIYCFLQKSGIPVRVHFGVCKEKGKEILGHGWLTLNGKPYLQTDRIYEGFQEIYSYS
ncbi:MAG: lasso peptide biosynthesis B2 protein [bacterium]